MLLTGHLVYLCLLKLVTAMRLWVLSENMRKRSENAS